MLQKNIQLNLTWNLQKYLPFGVGKRKKLNFDPKITEENEYKIWANTMHSRGLEQDLKEK